MQRIALHVLPWEDGGDVLPQNWTSENWENQRVCSPPIYEGHHEEEQVFGGTDYDGVATSGCGSLNPRGDRALGISEATYYVWRKRYGQMAIAEIRRLRWSMDFVADTLLDGRRMRALTVVDNWSRHSPFIETDFARTGSKVVTALERVAKRLSE